MFPHLGTLNIHCGELLQAVSLQVSKGGAKSVTLCDFFVEVCLGRCLIQETIHELPGGARGCLGS